MIDPFGMVEKLWKLEDDFYAINLYLYKIWRLLIFRISNQKECIQNYD